MSLNVLLLSASGTSQQIFVAFAASVNSNSTGAPRLGGMIMMTMGAQHHHDAGSA
jgi:hypothetical protein